MLQRYRTLAAMARLQEFTVAELAEFAGVQPATVRTVLAREKHRVTEISHEARTGRGGRFIRYRLNEDQLPEISSALKQLEDAPQLLEKVRAATAAIPDDEVPPALRVAEYTLLQRLPRATDLDTKFDLLDLAKAQIDDATEDNKLLEVGLLGRAGLAHAHAARWLHDLTEAELQLQTVADDKATAACASLSVLRPRYDVVVERVKDAQQFDLLAQLEERFDSNDLVRNVPANQPEIPLIVVTLDDNVRFLPRVVGEYMQSSKVAWHIALGHAQELKRALERRRAVCLLALPSNDVTSIHATVEDFLLATQGSAGDAVVSESFNPLINGATTAHGLRYVVAEGLEPRNVRGMLTTIASSPGTPRPFGRDRFAPRPLPLPGALTPAAVTGSSTGA